MLFSRGFECICVQTVSANVDRQSLFEYLKDQRVALIFVFYRER